jgi:hypothetical protein
MKKVPEKVSELLNAEKMPQNGAILRRKWLWRNFSPLSFFVRQNTPFRAAKHLYRLRSKLSMSFRAAKHLISSIIYFYLFNGTKLLTPLFC